MSEEGVHARGTSGRRASPYAGADWMEHSYKTQLSPLGRDVADLLGEWVYGIYHLAEDLRDATWDERVVIIRYRGDLSTFDPDNLTRLVLLAHEYAIRVAIMPRSARYLTMHFFRREHRKGRDLPLWRRHPDIPEMLHRFMHTESE